MESRSIILEKMSLKHIDYISQCFSNDAFLDLYRVNQKRNCSVEELEEVLTNNSEYSIDELNYSEWVIFKKTIQDNIPIGVCCLANYSSGHCRAELSVGIENDKFKHTSAFVEALLLLLDFGFNELLLNKIICKVYDHNKNSQRNFKKHGTKFGFLEEGFLVDHCKTDNGFVSVHQNALLNTSFRSNNNIVCLSEKFMNKNITIIK